MQATRTPINDPKLLRVWTPSEVVDGTLLVQCHTTVEIPSSAEQIQATGLPVVTLVGLVHVSLGENEDLSAERVPLDGRAVRLEEVLLAQRRPSQAEQVIDFDAGRRTLQQ